MTKVRAIDDVTYAQHDYKKGDEFETEDEMHAKLLSLNHKVVVVEEGVAPLQSEAPKTRPRRGSYGTRDMRATK